MLVDFHTRVRHERLAERISAVRRDEDRVKRTVATSIDPFRDTCVYFACPCAPSWSLWCDVYVVLVFGRRSQRPLSAQRGAQDCC